MKKGPLSNEEKELITALYNQPQSPFVIAEKLDRSINMVEKFLKTLPPLQYEQPQPTAEEEEKSEVKANAQDLYARKIERGVVVSTQAASMAADQSRENRKVDNNVPRYSKHIHKIKPQ